MHMTVGEAIVLHRIGVQKQLAGDDNAAITYYKQAVGRYLDSPMEPHSLGLSVDLDDLVSSSVRTWSPIDWLTKDLISLLLKYRRTGDAYPYESLRRSFAVQRLLYPLPAGFSDQGKGALFTKSMELRQRRQQDALEMFYASRARNKDYLESLQRQTAATRTELDTAIATLSRKYPRFAFLRRSLASPDDGRRIPSGSTVIDYVVENNECWAFVLENGQDPVSVKISSFGWELEQTMKKFMAAYERRADADMEWLSAKLYYILIHPLERYGRQRFIFLPIPGLEKFPFHALSINGRPLIDMIEVSYLPSVDFLGQEKRFPSFINTVVAFGFSPDPRWGLEFELRDIRSFFRNTQVFVNQSATEERLKNSFGEVLQLSTQFQTTDRTMTCTVSDGTPSTAGMNLPVSAFASLYPFPLVYLEDVQSRVNNIRPPHSIYWLLNGSSAVITTEFPSNAKMSNRFREQFYISLEASAVPYGAYRTAVRRLADDRSPSADKNWPSYFYYGM
jgi:hypothetical protein